MSFGRAGFRGSALNRSPTSPPDAVADLRVAVMAGRRHLSCLRNTCQAIDVLENDWDSTSEPPHLLLIESSGLRERPGGQLVDDKVERALELTRTNESLGVPTALWETSRRARIATPVGLLEAARHLFVADPEASSDLADQLGGRRPMQLPLAAQKLPKRVRGFLERPNQIVFLGHWTPRFSGKLREELEAILDAAAEHGLIAFRRDRDRDGSDGFPDRFQPFAAPVRNANEAIDAFASSRLVVGFDPRTNARLMVPQIIFDALAAGSGVIAPDHLGLRRLFPYVAATATTRAEAESEITRLLEDEDEWTAHSNTARTAILNGHTYAHRIATIASAAGIGLIPDP